MMRLLPVLVLVSALSACGGPRTVAAEERVAGSPGPVETRPPNGAGQRPALAGQTRAPQPATASRVTFATFATGLDRPWAIEALPDGRLLVTEKPGRLRVVMPDGRLLGPIDGVPRVDARGQGGLLDVAVRAMPDGAFTVCLSYAEPHSEGGLNATAVSCGRASGAENIALEPMRVVFRQEPAWRSTGHFGSRIVFTPDGLMFVTLGERMSDESRTRAQTADNTIGKIVRIGVDGAIPSDNPFASRGGPGAAIWSLGHRNLQAAAWRPETGALWTVEHGPRGGDELNRPLPGKNYGWPVITYGVDYNGRPIGAGITAKAGLEQPAYYWDPVIAPSGMIFHSGRLFAGWRGDALIGGLASRSVTRLVFDGDRVAAEERIAVDGRVRDVAEGPDGSVFLAIDADDGRILRMTPAP
jgi:glucose/arabinose dehydrogenase